MNVRSFIVYASQKGRKDINIFFFRFALTSCPEHLRYKCAENESYSDMAREREGRKMGMKERDSVKTPHRKPVLRPFASHRSRFKRIERKQRLNTKKIINSWSLAKVSDESMSLFFFCFPVRLFYSHSWKHRHTQPTLYSIIFLILMANEQKTRVRRGKKSQHGIKMKLQHA